MGSRFILSRFLYQNGNTKHTDDGGWCIRIILEVYEGWDLGYNRKTDASSRPSLELDFRAADELVTSRGLNSLRGMIPMPLSA